MEPTVAKIQIERIANGIIIKTMMPIWQRTGEDGQLYISMPLLGIETMANNEDDSEDFIKEALRCFCIIAEKHGRGLKKELEALGWNAEKKHPTNSDLLNVNPKTPLYAEMFKTGSPRAYQLQI